MTSTTLFRPEKFQIGRVFNTSFAVIGRNAGLCLGLAALFSALPTLILDLWAKTHTGNLEGGDPAASAEPEVILSGSVVIVGFGLLYFILSLLLQSALVRATIEDLNGKKPSFADCVSIAIRCLLPTLGIGLLVGLGVGFASMALLVPGILLWLGWCVSVPVLVQERLGVFGSMARSRALAKGSRWSLLGLFVILFLFIIAVELALGTVLLLFGGIVATVLNALGSAIISTVLSIATAVSYVELRQVKEGTGVNELAEIFS